MTELLADDPPIEETGAAAEPAEGPEFSDIEAAHAAAGDAAAFRRLFELYYDRLWRYARRYLQSDVEAADVVEDVFLGLWRHRRRIGLERDILSYMYAMTRNRALSELKHRKVETRFRERRAAELALEDPASAPDPETEFAAKEQGAALQKAMDTLPPRQRQVLELRWYEQLSYQEVADRLGISPRTVAIHLTRALEHLRERLPGFLE